jgi:rare lipoprotein A
MAQLDAALQNTPAPAVPTDGDAQGEDGDEQEAEAPNVAAASEDGASEDETSEDETSEDEVLETFEGKASWYGPGLEGNQTANGETFDPSQLTAAHRSLPFDTMLRVTNLNNGRVVTVRINDRGPFVSNRVLDLSSGAADELQMKGDGVATIRGEVLSYGDE